MDRQRRISLYAKCSENVDEEKNEPVTPMFAEGEPTQIPRLTHMLFQGMFFIITPALICGAFAERMKFSTMVVFMILWGTFVYCPLCHWVWGGGILAFVKMGETGNGLMGGALDFAGGTVVHISSGVSALICALLIGKRLGFGNEPKGVHHRLFGLQHRRGTQDALHLDGQLALVGPVVVVQEVADLMPVDPG